MIAYLVTNTANGKRYVGISQETTHRSRWTAHTKRAALGCTYALHRAMRKHGAAAFTVATVAEADCWPDLCEIERRLIRQYDTFGPDGYNMTAGGDGWLGGRHSEEQGRKWSIARKGKKLSAAHIESLRAANTGSKRSAATKALLSAKARERPPRSPDVLARMAATKRAQGFTPILRAAFEKAWACRRGARLTPEHRKRISAALSGTFATGMRPVVGQILASGAIRERHITDALNSRNIPARHGGTWQQSQVHNLLVLLGLSYEQRIMWSTLMQVGAMMADAPKQ